MKKNYDDLTGMTFGRFKVLSKAGEDSHHRTLLNCLCSCGEKRVVERYNLRSGHSKSCGCQKRDKQNESHLTHGHSRKSAITSEYRIWLGMKMRCINPKVESFKYYGGRGIKVCDRWIDSFENFFSDMGKRPTVKHSIDRINVNGNYEPSNCRWASPIEQRRNRRD